MKKLIIILLTCNLFASYDYNEESKLEDIDCLAKNIYFEARSSNLADQAAVADVVLNRVNSTKYPNTICEVVEEGPKKESWKTKQDLSLSQAERIYFPIKDKCQFSWYCDGKSDEPQDQDAWIKAVYIATNMIEDSEYRGISEGALNYHADYVMPDWAKNLQLVGTIGRHIFYRQKD